MSNEKLSEAMAAIPALDHEPVDAEIQKAREDAVAQPAMVASHDEVPPLDDTITALLIMGGCVAKFVGTYWIVEDRNRKRVHLHLTASFEEWRDAVSELSPHAVATISV